MSDDLDFQQLHADTAARLRPLCPDMSEDEFGRMVSEMVAVQSKYEERQRDVLFGNSDPMSPDAGPFPDTASPPPSV